ncbi:PQQ-like beta-propeller repeat protein [Pelagibacteraceae bacterium]|nr:PQQ-like beta-propeller repeat protein [Pelagibacteraceae bacterium]
MRSCFLIFITLLIVSCSFDNKTGIWRDASTIEVDNQVVESLENESSNRRYEEIFIKEKIFNEEINPLNTTNFELDAPLRIVNWVEHYGSPANNISNYYSSRDNTLFSKSSRLSKFSKKMESKKRNFIFFNDNFISYDHKGKIYVYSLKLKKKTFEYNFYKKSFKKFKKKVYLTINKNTIYAADNLGYLYAINIKTQSLIWAKNYGIPFRSNIKIIGEQILLANQDNVIYSIDKNTGDKKWQFATSITALKSDFENNFALDSTNENLFFLNTSGELYSINYLSQKINWILNFKNSSLGINTDIFSSQPLIIKNDYIVVSTKEAILNYNVRTGFKNWSFSSAAILKPVLTSNYTYLLSKNDLLICLDNKSGKVLWSKDVYTLHNTKKMKKKIGKFYDLKIVNNELNIFSTNGYLLSFNYKNGKIEYLKKISKSGISSEIILLEDSMYLIDSNNKLLKFN